MKAIVIMKAIIMKMNFLYQIQKHLQRNGFIKVRRIEEQETIHTFPHNRQNIQQPYPPLTFTLKKGQALKSTFLKLLPDLSFFKTRMKERQQAKQILCHSSFLYAFLVIHYLLLLYTFPLFSVFFITKEGGERERSRLIVELGQHQILLTVKSL